MRTLVTSRTGWVVVCTCNGKENAVGVEPTADALVPFTPVGDSHAFLFADQDVANSLANEWNLSGVAEFAVRPASLCLHVG